MRLEFLFMGSGWALKSISKEFALNALVFMDVSHLWR